MIVGHYNITGVESSPYMCCTHARFVIRHFMDVMSATIDSNNRSKRLICESNFHKFMIISEALQNDQICESS